MATIRIDVGFPSLDELREAFKGLPQNLAAKYMGAALREAIKPGRERLRAIVSSYNGPTKNLLRSVDVVVRKYPRTGSAVGLAGFVRSGTGKSRSAQGGNVRTGKDRAFHQGFLEFGTKPRRIGKPASQRYERKSKNGLVHTVNRQGGYIASSYGSLGPFKVVRRGKDVSTKPAYQKAFFVKRSEPIVIPPMRAKKPVATAFEQTKGRMNSVLREQLAGRLEGALREIAFRQTRAVNTRGVSPRF